MISLRSLARRRPGLCLTVVLVCAPSFAWVASAGTATAGEETRTLENGRVIFQPPAMTSRSLPDESTTVSSERRLQHSEPGAVARLSASRQVVVKLTDEVEICAAQAFQSERASEPGETSVAAQLVDGWRDLGVRRVSALVDRSEIDAGDNGRLDVSEIRAAGQHKAGEVAAKRGRSIEPSELPAFHHVYVLTLGSERPVQETIDALASPSVIWAEPLRLYRHHDLPNDPYVDDGGSWRQGSWGQGYPDQWGLESLNWGEVWARRSQLWDDPQRIGGAGLTIAVVDTGVDVGHPDLVPNLWRDGLGNPGADFVDIDVPAYESAGYLLIDGEDYVDPDSDPQDRQGHGTHVAGIAAGGADDGVGMAGVAWKSTLLPVRAGFAIGIDEDGGTTGIFESDDLAAAIVWAVDSGADILNFSWGGSRSQVIADALAYARGLGALMVAAAGNADDDVRYGFPADEPGVLSVGAVGPDGLKAPFSNWGERLDLAAPGMDVLSTRAADTLLSSADELVGDFHIRASGTSMAAPFVAGAAALVWAAHPELTSYDVADRLLGTALQGTELLPGLTSELPLGAGVPRLVEAIESAPEPQPSLLSIQVDPLATSTSDGNRSAEAGEEVVVRVRLLNRWTGMGPGTLRWSLDDPFAQIGSSPESFSLWPQGLELEFETTLTVAAETPRYHSIQPVLRVEADGYVFDRPIELIVNGSRHQILATEGPEEAFYDSDLASDAQGRTALVWQKFLIEERRSQMMARLFDAQGEPRGEPFLLHPDDSVQRADPQVAMTADGNWAVVWRTFEGEYPDTKYTVEMRRFDIDGSPIGETKVLELPDEIVTQDLEVAIDDSGTVAVAWWAFEGNDGIRVALFDPQGDQIGDIFHAETDFSGFRSNPGLAFDDSGRLLVSWRWIVFFADDSYNLHTMARLFRSDGTPITEPFRVSEESSRFNLSPAVAGGGEGFVVAWEWCDRPLGSGGNGLCSSRARRLASDGTFLTDELVLRPADDYAIWNLDAVIDDDGTFGVAWEACLAAGCELQFLELAGDGRIQSELYRIDSMNPLHDPAVTRLAEEYLIAWDHTGFSPFDIEGQVFLPQRPGGSLVCAEDEDTLCLVQDRFEIEISWSDFEGGSGSGVAETLSSNSGYFSFFDPDNVEILVKVLDGRAINGHWWVFYASLSNVEYQMTVRDTQTGEMQIYHNPLGRFAAGNDVTAFAEAPGNGLRSMPLKSAGTMLPLHDGRFQVEVTWTDFEGQTGDGVTVPLTDDSGAFWFFDESNTELVVKILDGRAINGHWWVFYGAMTNVGFNLKITDTETGVRRTFVNPIGLQASRGLTDAF